MKISKISALSSPGRVPRKENQHYREMSDNMKKLPKNTEKMKYR